MTEPHDNLEAEARWIEDEYERCFGLMVAIQEGTPMRVVHGYQAAIIRHWVEQLKRKVQGEN